MTRSSDAVQGRLRGGHPVSISHITPRSIMKSQHSLAAAFGSVFLLSAHAPANPGVPKTGAAAAVVLTDAGKALESRYASLQATLKAELGKVLPGLDDAKVAAWQQAILAEEGPAAEAAAKEAALAKLRGAAENLRKMEENLKYAPQTLEDAQAELQRARARGEEDPERARLLASSESFLASRQKEVDQLKAGFEKARTAVQEAEAALPAALEAAKVARQAHDKALSATWQAMDALGAGDLLGSGALDGKLARYLVITTATPRGLAEFAGKGPEHVELVEQLLADEALMIQMLVADGPAGGKFGEAMKIYTDIRKASPRAEEGVFQRLALATSLAHAVPVAKREQGGVVVVPADAPASAFIDPVQRYLSYEKWYLAGELQPGFKDLSVWNLIRVVDTTDPDDMLAWGREMLHTLRPDCVPGDGDTSVFVEVVDKEIAYTSAFVKDDLPERHFMQNILANGGICGRRGFFGRFILQAFGVPSTERVEPGHSALTLWHPDGWQTKLGHDWGKSNRGFYAKMGAGGGGYGADVNFLASSQAREDEAAFMRVKRAQWIGAVMGEPWKPGLITWSGKTKGPTPPKPGEIVKPSTWNDLGLHEQRRIIAAAEASKPRSSATPSVATKEPAATGKASVDAKGVITLPSAACSSPAVSKRSLYRGGQADLVVFLDNKAGDTLLHLSRYAKGTDSFEYTFDAPKAGKYQLVADLATPKPNQKLFATVNGGPAVEMALPYTIGLWGKSSPVEVELEAGGNVLRFHGPARATFKRFTLAPDP